MPEDPLPPVALGGGGPKLLGVATAVGASRRLTGVVASVLDAAERSGCSTALVDVQALGLPFADGRPHEQYEGAAAQAIAQIAAADGLVLGTAAYRATFSALLKNLLELIPLEAVAGKPCCVVVTGGARDHALVADYAVRPVLVHMGMEVTARSVYADPSQMPDGGSVPSSRARSRTPRTRSSARWPSGAPGWRRDEHLAVRAPRRASRRVGRDVPRGDAPFPAAVSIIATADGGQLAAMTATAVTSYSANPPSMLCCIDHQARSHDALERCERFSISVLHTEQSATALLFSRSDDEKFGHRDLAMDGDRALPYIDGALATLLCERAATYSHYDHSVLVGRVIAGRVERDRSALLYAGRRFWALADVPGAAGGAGVTR